MTMPAKGYIIDVSKEEASKYQDANRRREGYVEFMFNPTEFTVSKSANWDTKDRIGENVPETNFGGGQPRTLKMNLLFDVLEQPGVSVNVHLDKLWKFLLVDNASINRKTNKGKPPLCRVIWGGQWSFKAVITSLSVTYTLFREDGTPVRAKADVQFQEAVDEAKQAKTNPTSYGEAGLKRREVHESDTLAGIAFEEYGDPNHWRAIATANALDNPLDLRSGQVLAIPAL